MRSAILLLIAMFCYRSCYSVDNLRIPDIRSISMGGNISTQSITFNPALLVYKDHKEVSISYFNRFMIKELGNITASFHYPNKILSTSVDISAFGFDKYREMMLRVSASKQLHEKWALGLAIHYSFLQTELSDKGKYRVSTDIGATFKPFDNLLIGMLIVNLPSTTFGDKDLDIDDFKYYTIQIGFQYHIINNMLISCSAGSDKDNRIVGNLGIEYNAIKSFHIRAGLRTAPLLPSLGIGYDLLRFKLDMALVYHPVLGVSSGVGISFFF